MKKITYPYILKAVLLSCLTILVFSCKKDNLPTDPARIFKPGDLSVSAGATSARLKWTKPLLSSGRSYKYSIDFAKDSLFQTVAFTATSDTLGYVVTESNLAVRTKYFARVKAIATADQPESKYAVSAGFSLSGTQLFLQTRDGEIKETGVTLRYTPTSGLSSIVITPATGTAVTISLSTTDASAGFKAISGLIAGTKYSAELFAGNTSKGLTSFTTLAPTAYTQVLSPSDDLAAAIAAAANNAVIGLNPGIYDLSSAVTFITQKTITLKSTSGNASDTKINYKEIDLEGTGAGITVAGIHFDGTAGNAAYFINFIGSQANNAVAATFTNVMVDNCIVHDAGTAFMRGNRGSAAKDHKITGITVNNSVVYNFGANGTSSYYAFHLDKMQFNTLNVTKSTFYNFGPGLLIASTSMSVDPVPTVTVSSCTLNGFGGSAKYALLDANANPVNFSIQNSIIANTPKSGTVNAAAVRASAAGIALSISNSDCFNLVGSLGGTTPLTFGATALSSNQTVALPWTADTNDFTLPAGSALRTAGSTGGAIGDPRWTY
nr:DUF4957 domain-containing protein [Pedobacter sp. ASV19]